MMSNNLADMLALRGLTARAVAERVEITEATMSLYVNGKRTPRVDVAQRIALVLGCDVRDLFPTSFNAEPRQVEATDE